ncbi:hypothetical protein ABB07_30585 [Streptomyces incarnatus]|uniref:Uncharacterized protein n=1 Tax=Streptomyces incarnatus TaxID=665007 RepID=A0ABN4GLC9_9ACTN|nr:hypothetical protein ABB07_30585 [Streptomyces incarnatus]
MERLRQGADRKELRADGTTAAVIDERPARPALGGITAYMRPAAPGTARIRPTTVRDEPWPTPGAPALLVGIFTRGRDPAHDRPGAPSHWREP